MEDNKKTTQILRDPPGEKRKFFWVLLVLVLIFGIWIGVQGANQGVLTLATSAQGLTDKDGDIKVRVRAIDAANMKESLYTIDQTAVVKDGQLKLRWQIPPTAKKKAAYIEICAMDKRAGPSSAVKKTCIQQSGGVAYNKVSCPYYVPANSTGFSGQLNGWNKLDDSQKVGCSGDRSFSKVSSLKALAEAQSPGIQVDGGGVLVAEDGKIETKNIEQFVQDALANSGGTVVHVTTNSPTAGAQGPAGANGVNGTNGTNGADGAVGIATVSGGGLILTGQNLSLDDSCLGGQILQWDGANWVCASVSGTDSQTLSLVANVLAISGGNSVNLAGYLDNTDSQALSWVGGTRTLSLTGGGSVVISDSDTTYSAGNGLSLSGTTFSINSPTCAGTTKLTWNGTAFSCAADVDTDTTNFNVAANGGAGQNISSGGTVNFTNGTGTTASRSGSDISFGLANTAVTGGTYSASNNANGSLALPQFTVDAQGRLTAASTSNVTLTGIANSQLANSAITVNTAGGLSGGSSVSLGGSVNLTLDLSDVGDANTANTNSGSGLEVSGGEIGLLRGCSTNELLKYNATSRQWACAADTDTNSGGTVTSITAGTGLSGGTITTTGTIDIANTGVTAATYGSSTSIPVIAVNAQGQITSASSTAIPTASTSTTGLLTSTDWNTFNGKENVLTFNGNGLFSRSGNTITGLACSGSQIAKWNSGAFACGTDVDTDTTYSAGNGLSLSSTTFSINSPTCSGTDKLQWTGTAFVCSADVDTDTGVTSIGTIDSQTKSANGAVISGTSLVLQTADGSNPGLVSTTTQTFAGAKTFSGSVNANGDVTLGDAAADGITITGEIRGASPLAFEGVTNDGVYTTFAITDPTLARTITFPDRSGTVSLSGDTFTGDVTGTLNSTGATALTIAANSVALGTDTTGDYVAGNTAGNGISVTGSAGEGWSPTIAINSPTCAGTDKLTWNGSAFSCASDVDTDTDTTNFNVAAAGTGGSQNISSGGTVTFGNGTGTTATRSGSTVTYGLNNTAVSAGTYSPSDNADGSLALPQFTVDAQGRLTAASTTNVTLTGIANSQLTNSAITVNTAGGLSGGSSVSLGGTINLTLDLSDAGDNNTATTSSGSGLEVSGGEIGLLRGCSTGELLKYNMTSKQWACAADTDTNSGGTVTSIIAGTGLTGGTITTSGTINIATTGVTAATYGSSTSVPVITVNAQGQITAASSSAIPTADTSTTGLLTDTDWDTFNGKENVLTFNGNGLFSRSGNTVTGLACSAGEIPKWSGSAFACGADAGGASYTAGNGLTLTGASFSVNSPTCSGTDKLQWTGTAFICSADVDTDTGVTSIGTIDSQTKSANGAVISGTSLVLQTADGSSPGLVSTTTQTFAGAKTFSGNVNANGDVTLGDAAADGITITGEIRGASPLAFEGSTNDGVYTTFAITDPTGARTVTFADRSGTVSLSGDTFTGDVTGTLNSTGATALTIAANSVALGTDTTGDYVANVTAGGGLTGTATGEGSTPTLAIVSSNGGIVVNADDIALTITASANALSSTTSSGSGLEILASGLTLLQGCSDTQILKWNETTDLWSCSADVDTDTGVTSIGTIDSQTKSANGAVISGSVIYLQTADASNVGLVSTGTQTFAGNKTFNGNVIADANLTVNGDIVLGNAATDAITFTGEIRGASPLVFEGATNDDIYTTFAITDPTLARTITFPDATGTVLLHSMISSDATVSSAGVLTIAANAVALGTDTTGDYVSNVTAGGGLTGSATGEGSTPTLAIVSSNGGIVVNADDIALTIAASANGLSATTSSGSGLEILASGVTLLQGCSDTQLLKWNETTDVWACASDTDTDTDTGVTSVGTIDSQTKSANGAVISGTVVYLQTADASNPGLVSTGTQTFAGDKTFNGNVVTGGNLNANGDVTLGDAATDGITLTGEVRGASPLAFEGATNDGVYTTFAITDPTTARTITFPDRSGTVSLSGDTFTGDVTGTLNSTGATTLTIAANSVALGTDTTGDYVASNTAGNGIAITGSTGEGWSPTVSINAPTCSGTDKLQWNGTAFVCAADVDTDTGVTTIGTLDSLTKSANGAVISGTTLVLQTADATMPGLVSTGTQTFAGAKTFNDDTTIFSQSDSATAFQVQNSLASPLFNVDASTASTIVYSPYDSTTAFQVQNSVAGVLFNVDAATGSTTVSSNGSTTALQVLNGTGDQVMNVDTSNIVNNLVTNPSFEVDASGWGYGNSDTTQAYVGKASLRFDTFSASDGTSYDVALASDTTYTLSFYAKAGSENYENFTSMYAGYYDGTLETDCLTSQTVSSSGWTRYSCTFTTGTISGTPNIYIRQNDSTDRAVYIDGVQLLNNSLPSNIVTGTSSTFESGVGGWGSYSSGAITQSSTQAHMGTYSGRMITTGGGNENGVAYGVSGLVNPSTTYTIKAYIKADTSSASATYQLGHTLDDNQVTTSSNGCNIVTPTSSVWKVLTCTFTTASSLRPSPYITITQKSNLSTSTTTYVDSISMYDGADVGGTDQGFTMGSISLNGAISSPALFQNTSNSTTAFQIQGANSSAALLVADTLNNRVAIGKNTAAYTLDVEGVINASESVITPRLTSLAGTALAIDSGTTGAINIGTGANAKTITIGNATGATSVVVNCGTGACSFGANATVHATTLGSLTGASNTIIQAGTGGLTLGSSGVANTLQIGNTTGAVSQTINIGTNSTASSTNNVNIGSTVAGTTAIAGPTTITGRTSGSSGTLIVDNSTSTGSIFVARDNGTAVLTVANNGGATFKTVTNTASAFKTTNSANDVLLNVGTAQSLSENTNLINNSSFESGSNGWTGKSGGSMGSGTGGGSVTGISYMNISMDAAGEGGYYPITLSANTDYTLSVYARTYWGAMNTLVMGHQDQFGTDIDDCVLSSETIDTDWHRVSCSFTTGSTISSSNVYIRQSDATSRVVDFDAVQLQASPSLSAYNMGEVYFNAPINQSLIITGNGYSGGTDLTFQVQDSVGALQFGVSAAGQVTVANGLAVNGGDITSTATTFNFLQSNVTELNIGAAVGASGINLAGGSGSTGCTVEGTVGNFTCSGNIVSTATSGIQGWWTRSGTTLQPGNSGDNITTSGNLSTTGSGNITSAGGLQVDGNTILGDATTDTIMAKGSMIANLAATGTTDTTSGTGSNTTTLTIAGTSFANNDVILIDNAGQDYYTRVTAGGGTSSLTVSPAVTFETSRTVTKYNIQNIGATDSDYTTQGNRFFQGYFLGGVVTGAGSTTLSDGRLHSTVGLNFDAPSYTFTNSSNSTSAFRVNRADGENLVKFDTVTTENLLSNGNFESNTTGWVAHGSSTVSQTGSQYYLGTGSMSVATTAAANDGAKYNYALASQTTYTMTFYVKNSTLTGTASTINIGRSEDGSTDSDCATTQTINGGGWSKLTCTFTTGNVTGTDYIYLKQTDAIARTMYIDSVQLQTSTNLSSNPDVEVNTSGWGTYGAPTLSQTTSEAYTGSGSLQVDTSASASAEGPMINPTPQPNTTYTASFWVKTDAATSGSKNFQLYKRFDSVDGVSTSCTSATLSPGVWTNMTCTFTTGSVTAASPYIGPIVIDDGVTPITYYVDNASVSVTKWNSNDIGRISLNGAIDSPLTVRGAQDSTSALQVQQQNGKNILTVDTLNGRVGIGTDTATRTFQVDGKALIRATSTDTDTFQVTNTATVGTANSVIFNVAGSSRAVSVGLSTNSTNSSLSVYGTQLIKTLGNSANAFRIQDASGVSALTFATTSGNRKLTIGGTGTGNDGGFLIANSSGTVVTEILSTGNGSAYFSVDDFQVNSYTTGLPVLTTDAAGNVGIGQYGGTYPLDVIGDINSSTGYRIAGTAGASTTCSGGQFLQDQVTTGGLTTGGTCANAVTTVGSLGGSIANGASISGNTITFGTADASNPGLVSTGTQTIAGAKTFTSAIAANGGITFDNSTDTLSAFTLSGTQDAATNLITNIGDSGTDFVAGGGLTLAGTLTANGALTVNTCTNSSTNVICAGGNTRAADITIGTNDGNALIFETNNTAVGRFTSTGELLINTATNTLNAQLVVNSAAGKDTGMNVLGNVNSFYQINIQNTNSGSSASSDFVATADNGTATTNYVDFGINGSTGGAAPFTGANDAYLYASDSNNLHIGALGSSGAVKFYTTGGTSSPSLKLTLDSLGALTQAASSSTTTAFTLTANSLTSGNGLAIGSTSASLTGNLFSTTSASTGAFSNGGVRFNFTGAHTGVGVKIDDVTTTGTVAQINASALTTGTAFEVTGPSAAKLLRVKNDSTQSFNKAQLIIGEGDANNPDALARDQLYVFGRINSSWNQLWADCLTNEGTKTAATTPTGAYGASWSGGVTTPRLSQANTAGISGACRMAFATPLANATGYFGSGGLVTQRSLNPVFETSVLATSDTDTVVLAGFSSLPANANITASTNQATEEVFFRKQASNTQWEAVTRSTANSTENITTNVGSNNAYHRFRIELDDTAAAARFYVDGTLVATHSTNAVPATAARLGFGITHMVTSTTSRNLDIDYLRGWSDDPPPSIAPEGITQTDGVDTTNQTETSDTGASPPEDNSNDALLTRIKDLEVDVSDLKQYKDVLTVETLSDASTKKAVFIADTEFRKQVEFSADALFKANVNVDGTLNANGRVVVSNNTGTITVQPGQTEVQVIFTKPLAGKPNVFLSTENPDVKVVAQTRTANGFIIKLSQPITDPVDVQWFAVEKD